MMRRRRSYRRGRFSRGRRRRFGKSRGSRRLLVVGQRL